MFERYTERARAVIVLGQDEARALKHNYIGTEHLLLGLIREEEGMAARVLASLDVTLDEVRRRVVETVGLGDEVLDAQIPFTPRSKKVLEFSLREALSLGHNYIATEHILLGLVRENEGVATDILDALDATAETVRNAVGRELTPGRYVPKPNTRQALGSLLDALEAWQHCPHTECDTCRSRVEAQMLSARKALA